jgi:lipopolysaccharide biosynthesis protein
MDIVTNPYEAAPITDASPTGTAEPDDCMAVRAIAFYLPQYHPIPENDAWWGKGFTEWTNVTKAKPLFPGHRQPNLPADLGFYDLRLPEVREKQAQLARQAGIEGFCYWHYWFGNGRKILERPIAEVLADGRPDFPFCLCWANGSWSGIWHGASDRILMQQQYPGTKDYEAFFYDTLPAFRDHRYITVAGCPLFIIYDPSDIPDLAVFIEVFRRLAKAEGLKGLYLMGLDDRLDYNRLGLDGIAPNLPAGYWGKIPYEKGILKKLRRQIQYRRRHIAQHWLKQPRVYPFFDFMLNQPVGLLAENEHTTVLPNWDNTPRSGTKGLVLQGATPYLFGQYLQKAIQRMQHKPNEKRLLFIKSWNEWAEGNYLEPDQTFGHGWLEACRQKLFIHTAVKS